MISTPLDRHRYLNKAMNMLLGIRMSLLQCFFAVICFIAVCALGDGGATKTPEVLDLAGARANVLDLHEARARVFLFVSTDCPISNSYAPEFRRLASEFEAKGIEFRLVYPNGDESADDVRKHQKEYNLPIAALRDPKHQLVKIAHVRVTPEAAVYVRGDGWIYRGRIDDRFVDFGKTRPAALQHDLRDIVEKIADGKTLSPSSTRAVGCYISGAE